MGNCGFPKFTKNVKNWKTANFLKKHLTNGTKCAIMITVKER